MTSPTVRALAVSRQFSMIEAELNENQLDQTNQYGTCNLHADIMKLQL